MKASGEGGYRGITDRKDYGGCPSDENSYSSCAQRPRGGDLHAGEVVERAEPADIEHTPLFKTVSSRVCFEDPNSNLKLKISHSFIL